MLARWFIFSSHGHLLNSRSTRYSEWEETGREESESMCKRMTIWSSMEFRIWKKWKVWERADYREIGRICQPPRDINIKRYAKRRQEVGKWAAKIDTTEKHGYWLLRPQLLSWKWLYALAFCYYYKHSRSLIYVEELCFLHRFSPRWLCLLLFSLWSKTVEHGWSNVTHPMVMRRKEKMEEGLGSFYILERYKRPAMAYFTFTMPHLIRVSLALLALEVGEETFSVRTFKPSQRLS